MGSMGSMGFNTSTIPPNNMSNYNIGGGSYIGSVGNDPFAEL
jgi:hypothetical protein